MTHSHDEPSELGRLASDLRLELNRLVYALRAPAARSGLTPTRLVALGALAGAPRGLRPGDLAAQMGVTAPTMTRLVEALILAGWVDKVRDDHDHRAVLLTLTEAGRSTISQVRGEATAMLLADLQALGESDREALTGALPVLRAMADRRLSAGRAGDV
ncbi:MAG: MarR family winged helix-turn-helix transcriptional regulator [Nostocoides sp.]